VFHKILIANRGEIALRVLRTCRDLGIRTVVAHSTADAESRAVQVADESICIGPPEARQSYLNIPSIISAAAITDCEAIHPGYGLLAENATFAEVCRACGITFIGPSPEAIRLMGDKAQARATAKDAGAPVVPGSAGPLESVDEARAVADQIGYPVMVKAAAGGGGRGMRIVREAQSLARAYATCQSESQAAFGSSELYLERFLEEARHVEVQVLGDRSGIRVHLGERDCSIQRRHQKLLEESPAPALGAPIRAGLCKAALAVADAVNYVSAGTVEFLVDRGGAFYFIEMNTRIQVEHPVTELVTGIDLVREQIRIAAGEPLGYRQDQIRFSGHAIECRINAEDPDKSLMPSPGRVSDMRVPGGPGVRMDTMLYPGYTVPPFYDSLLGKLIVHAEDRPAAIARMRRALKELHIEGVKTTRGLHLRLMDEPRFESAQFDTNFLEGWLTAARPS
jgi:acetyl-CoA carboxylase biotin carboxylase subunit